MINSFEQIRLNNNLLEGNNRLFYNNSGILYSGEAVPKGRYNSLSIMAGAMAPAASNGATASSTSFTGTHYLDCYSFDAATEQSVFFQFSLPDIYDNNSLKAKLFWSVASGGSSGVCFGIQGIAFTSGQNLKQPLGPESLITGYATNSGVIFQNTSNYINLTGIISGSDSFVLMKIARKINDPGDVCNKATLLYNCNLQWKESITEPQLWS